MDSDSKFEELEAKNRELERELEILRSAGKRDAKKESEILVLKEIFHTVGSYLALFSTGEDERFYITDLNSKVEEVEFIDKDEVIGKAINDTPLYNRAKLVELLNHLRITGEAHKLSASTAGDDSEGFYMGF